MPRPLRLFYQGNIFRWQENGKEKQVCQIGLELIGLGQPEACAELIAITEEVLNRFGIKDHIVVLCNVGFLKELLSPFEQGKRRKIAFALARKDRKGLETLLNGESIEPERYQLIMKLPDLVGGAEILNDIRSIFAPREIDVYLSELEDVISVLQSYGVSENLVVDLSEIRGMVYHTGFFFEVFVGGVGRRIAVGGRYDDLMKMYGKNEPALGFAFNLEDLFKAVFLKGKGVRVESLDVLVIDLSKVKMTGQRIAKLLRDKGFKVARDIISRPLEDSLSYAQHHGIRFAVVIREELKDQGLVEVHDLTNGEKSLVNEGELVSRLEV